jgi:hypothetical protein
MALPIQRMAEWIARVYLLRPSAKLPMCRDSSQQYVWVRKAGDFDAVLSRKEDRLNSMR